MKKHVAASFSVALSISCSAGAVTTNELVFATKILDVSQAIFSEKDIAERDKTILLSCLYKKSLGEIAQGTRNQIVKRKLSEKKAADVAISLLRYCETVPLVNYEKSVK
jgi:hypothetical protein